jgi:hypothetical protein
MAIAPSINVNLPGYPFQNLDSAATIADLRAIASTPLVNGQNIAVDGGAVIGDGSGGLFTWADLSTANDDNVNIIKPTDTAPLAAGRWISMSGSANALSTELASATGSGKIGYSRTEIYPVGSIGYKLQRDVPITPYDFGAVGWSNLTYQPGNVTTGAPDDGAALNAFYAFVFSGVHCKADHSGLFATSVPIVAGPTTNTYHPAVQLSGDITLVALAEMTTIFTQRNWNKFYCEGSLVVIGTGNFTWATRTCIDGLGFIGDNSSCGFTKGVFSQFLQGWNIRGRANTTQTPPGFLEWFKVPHNLGIACGSGSANPAYAAYNLTSAWSAPVNTGSVNSDGQRTTISVITLPPTWVDGRLDEEPVGININGKYHVIKSVDRPGGKIAITPWLYTADPTSGTLTYVIGGGFLQSGSDANVMNVGTTSLVFGGIAQAASSLYPGNSANVTAQDCAAGLAIGLAPNNVCIGGKVGSLYCEDNVPFNVLYLSRPNDGNTNTHFAINSVHTFNPDKYIGLAPHDGVNYTGQVNLKALAMPSIIPKWEKNINDVTVIGATDISIAENEAVTTWTGNTHLVRLKLFDAAIWRYSGRNARILVFSGTGANGQPTGTVTINASTIAGKLVNGVASVVYSGLTAPLSLLVTVDPATGNFTVSRTSISPAAAIPDLVAAPTQANINTILAALRTASVILP